MNAERPPEVRLLLADVDGTLVTPAKELTERAVRAVRALEGHGIAFAITSGRPPRGMQMLVAPLQLRTPIAAFNGGLLVDPDLTVLEQHVLPPQLVPQIIELIDSSGLDTWLYRGADWLLRDPSAPHVAREAATVQFQAQVVADFKGIDHDIAKIVGVSDDHALVAKVESQARERFGEHVSAARSQPYYLDITHPLANKGEVVRTLSRRLHVAPEQIATIGDMPNDVLMFAHSGVSIAMGQSDPEVQRAARYVTSSNEQEGFANAVERFILKSRHEGRSQSRGGKEPTQ